MTNATLLRVEHLEHARLWQKALDADPEAMVTQSPQWMNALTSSGKWRNASRIYELPDERLAAVPIAHRKPLGVYASPPHAWGFGGIVAEGGVAANDVRLVLTDLAATRALRQTIRPNPLQAVAWETGALPQWTPAPRFAHVIDLRDGSDAVFAGMHKDIRRQVRRAERLGVEIECDTTGRLIPAFYELLELSVVRWASGQHEPLRLAQARARHRDPIEKFRAMAQHLGPQFKLWMARHEGHPVAANLVLQGRNAHSTRGVMDSERARPVAANALLEWHAIQEAIAGGCTHYHMGESGTSSTIARAKRRFGAAGYEYAAYRREILPVSTVDAWVRTAVKRVIRFKD